MREPEDRWSEFHRNALNRPARELLRRTIGCFELEKRDPSVAVDLGCGSGAETLELLRRGWQVHAVDASAGGLAMLMESVPPPLRASLHTHAVRFEEFELPPCDLIWAGYSLPFCPAAHWPRVWNSLVEALRPEGRFAGDLFGDQHAWATASDIHVLTEDALRRQLEGLMIEAFDIENGVRPSGGILTRWHAFGVAVRKTNASAG